MNKRRIALKDFNIKIFADGADLDQMIEQNENPLISGFTTNPTLLRKSGVTNYEQFAKDALRYIDEKPISFEVFADEWKEMERQSLKIASWGENVYVKIPITNTKGQSSCRLISNLTKQGIKINVTAIMTYEQVCDVSIVLQDYSPSIISVFGGRIADTLRNPENIMKMTKYAIRTYSNNQELLWASPREILNVLQAEQMGVDIITLTNDLIKKLTLIGKNLDEYSLETVQLFYNDALKSGYTL